MWLYIYKSQFINVTQKSDNQGCDYKGGLLYHDFQKNDFGGSCSLHYCICSIVDAYMWLIDFKHLI
jgi:hypothetical protein